jgi:glutamate synthase (NADPH/NADH) large chain
VGVATQNPELRARFPGKPEFVVNFFEFIAEEVRELLARLGFRSIAEAVGQVDALDVRSAVDHWKAHGLDLSPVLEPARNPYGQTPYCSTTQDHGLEEALDQELVRLARPAIERGEPVRIELPVRNTNRTVGTLLGHHVTSRWRGDGLPDGTITVQLSGSAGQSFGAFVPRGITLRLDGDANDYLGKGLSGGRIVVRPHADAPFVAEENIIAGNVIAYGATAGEIYLRGLVGERFCVRNSGATAVVEGVGDHGCEYMTGGRVLVLGPTGRNFGAGMSGGIAYVYDPDRTFAERVNYEMVEVVEPDATDRAEIRQLLEDHVRHTDSAVAARILEAWSVASGLFRKVLPQDYKRVLDVIRDAEAAGLSEDETNHRIMEAARG